MNLVSEDVDILRKDVDILVLVTQDVDILKKDVDIFKHLLTFFNISSPLMLVVKSLSRLKKGRTVSESAGSEDFKTVPDFEIGQVEAEILRLEHTRGHFHF